MPVLEALIIKTREVIKIYSFPEWKNFGLRLYKGSAWNLLATVFNQGSTFAVNIIVARILMREGFGEYAMVQTTLLTMASLAQLSTGYTASKYIAEYRSTDPERVGRIMGLCTIVSTIMAGLMALILTVIAPWVAGSILKAPHLAFSLIMGSGFLFFSSINGYQMGALSGLEAYGGLARAGLVSGIVTVFLIPFGAWWYRLNGALIGLSISAFIRCVIHNRSLRLESGKRNIKPTYLKGLWQETEVIAKFALPAAMAGYFTMLIIWLANSFLVQQPGGFGKMALYSAANNIRVLVLLIPNLINNVALSILNNEKGKGDTVQYNRVFKSNILHIFLASLVGLIVMGVFGDRILQLFGKDFSAGYFLLWILLFSTIFEGLSIALYQYIQSQGKMWLSFISINIPRETFLVLAAYYLVQSYGASGLAAAYLGSTILGFIFHLLLVTSLYNKVSRVNMQKSADAHE